MWLYILLKVVGFLFVGIGVISMVYTCIHEFRKKRRTSQLTNSADVEAPSDHLEPKKAACIVNHPDGGIALGLTGDTSKL